MLFVDENVISKVHNRARTGWAPKILIVLGSGLGGLADKFDDGAVQVPFEVFWPWATSKLEGHAKTVIMGWIKGVPVMALAGRLHLYEGYKAEQVVQPVLLAKALGVEWVFLSNAAGGVRVDWQVGDLMIIVDHLNLTGQNALTGSNNDAIGPRFPGQSRLYTANVEIIRQAAKEAQVTGIQEGVYAGLTGPTYETPAEIRMVRTLGADAVGMSTVQEAMVANWAGMKVVGVTLISNMAAGITGKELHHAEVVEAGARAAKRFETLVMTFLGLIK